MNLIISTLTELDIARKYCDDKIGNNIIFSRNVEELNEEEVATEKLEVRKWMAIKVKVNNEIEELIDRAFGEEEK